MSTRSSKLYLLDWSFMSTYDLFKANCLVGMYRDRQNFKTWNTYIGDFRQFCSLPHDLVDHLNTDVWDLNTWLNLVAYSDAIKKKTNQFGIHMFTVSLFKMVFLIKTKNHEWYPNKKFWHSTFHFHQKKERMNRNLFLLSFYMKQYIF